MKHTKEPWVYWQPPESMYGHAIINNKGETICDFSQSTFINTVNEVDARRIVACVNALEGIPTDELEKAGTGMMSDAAIMVGKLTKQLDELKNALADLIMACELPGDHCEIEQALPQAYSAIAKCEGK